MLIEGARRVGKSTIVEAFGKNEYTSYILIDFAFAKVRQAIKSLVADGRYDYVETGSLISINSINKNVKDILIPSEERRISMYPLDFEEFLWALDDTATIPILEHFYKERQQLGQELNRELLRKFRLYMLIGGMPQAILEYLASNNMEKVEVKSRMLV